MLISATVLAGTASTDVSGLQSALQTGPEVPAATAP